MPGDKERHDVGETHGERVDREDKNAQEVRDLAGELKGNREELAGELKGNREELARNLEIERKERAHELTSDREELAQELKGDRVALAKRVRLGARSDVLIVGALLLLITVIGWYKIGTFTADLRDSAVEGCQRQNEVRVAVRGNTRDDVDSLQEDKAQQKRSAKTFQGATFGLSQAAFDKLIQDGIDRITTRIEHKRERIRGLPLTNCEQKYPSG